MSRLGAFDSWVQDEQEKVILARYEDYLIEKKAAVQDGYTTVYGPISFEDFCDDFNDKYDRTE